MPGDDLFKGFPEYALIEKWAQTRYIIHDLDNDTDDLSLATVLIYKFKLLPHELYYVLEKTFVSDNAVLGEEGSVTEEQINLLLDTYVMGANFVKTDAEGNKTDVDGYNKQLFYGFYTDEEKKLYPEGTASLMKKGTTVYLLSEEFWRRLSTYFYSKDRCQEAVKIFPYVETDSFFDYFWTEYRASHWQEYDSGIWDVDKEEKYDSSNWWIRESSLSANSLLQKKISYAEVLVISKSADGWLNISPFVVSVNTQTADGGGAFTIVLSYVPSSVANTEKIVNKTVLVELGGEGFENIPSETFTSETIGTDETKQTVGESVNEEGDDIGTVKVFDDITTEKYFVPNVAFDTNQVKWGKNGLYFRGATIDSKEGRILFNVSAFECLIQSNDVVYIRFCRDSFDFDELTKQGILEGDFQEYISSKEWDMIGLVDDVINSYNVAFGQQVITITGRDLNKLIIDDAVVNYPIVAPRGLEDEDDNANAGTYFLGNDAKNKKYKSYKRVYGAMFDLSFYLQSEVREVLVFIFKKLTTIEVVSEKHIKDIPLGHTGPQYAKVTATSTLSDDAGKNDAAKSMSAIIEQELDSTACGIWRLIDLIIDPSVKSRKISDSSSAVAAGSIQSFIKKFAQMPFVEFWGDTYGHKFYFFTRKPPYSFTGICSGLCSNSVFLKPDSIYSIDLGFSSEAYSWYRLIPAGFYYGETIASMFYFPAVFLAEYAAIFGMQALEISSNYVYLGAGDDLTLTNAKEQAIQDLKWLVLSYALLPFTRQGTLTIKLDRRIKKGSFIYLTATDEVFFVDGVSHSFSIGEASVTETTTLSVSRGMVLKYLKFYFNIVDVSQFDKMKERGLVGEDEKETVENWIVVKRILNFFLHRMQFMTSINAGVEIWADMYGSSKEQWEEVVRSNDPTFTKEPENSSSAFNSTLFKEIFGDKILFL